ncbi:MAG: glycosyltransferase family 39 protein [Endomicrobiales bacterium]|nr:glycosyltransferase family 39 protein [Endomicrobiales bacterium]
MPRKLAVLALILTHFSIILLSQKDKSPVYDEAFYMAYGYSLWSTGDYRMGVDKTPFAAFFSAFPLVFVDLNPPDVNTEKWRDLSGWQKKNLTKKELNERFKSRWTISLDFLFRNKVPCDSMLRASKIMPALASGIFALGMYLCCGALWGAFGGMTALIFYSFLPVILSNAGLVTEDIYLAGFYFFTFCFFWRFLESKAPKFAVISGVLAALAVLSKLTGLIIYPTILIMTPIFTARKEYPSAFRGLGLFVLSSAIVIAAFYRVIHVQYFISAVKNMLALTGSGHQTFLMGEHSGDGFASYYLYALLFKTPLPLLLMAAYPAVKLFSNKTKTAEKGKLLFFILPAAILLLISSLSPKQIGVRYVLPVYFFMIAAAADVRRFNIVVAGFLLWFAFSSLSIHPHYTAYFNKLAGGPDNGYRLLSDSNIDWGQDLKGLSKYVRKEGNPEVILSYYGACYPEYAGFEFQDLFSFGIWGDKNHLLSDSPKKEILAVSATNLVGVYLGATGRRMFEWLENAKPVRKIGYSIFVYDITNDYASHLNLAHIYAWSGQFSRLKREAKRLESIAPEDISTAFFRTISDLRAQDLQGALENWRIAVKKSQDQNLPLEKLVKNSSQAGMYSGIFNALARLSRASGFGAGERYADLWASSLSNQ